MQAGTGSICQGGTCACPGSTTLCGGNCIDTKTDSRDCGGCAGHGGQACPSAQSCVSGACVCSNGGTLCGSVCTNTQTDPTHCGGCPGQGGQVCPPHVECLSGTCSVSVTTLSGNGTAFYTNGTGGPNGAAEFNSPDGVAFDGQGNVYVADTFNNRIQVIAPSGDTTTFAGGTDTGGDADGTGGPAGTARFSGPTGVAVDGQGNVYVADSNNHRIRVIAPNGDTTTLAGNGSQGYQDGTGGRNGTAMFVNPAGLAVDSQGNVYVADVSLQRIRVVAPNGDTTTLAGNGTQGFVDGTGGANGTAEFSAPWGVALDSRGNLYVADRDNERIRRVSPSGATSTFAGNGTQGYVDGTGGANGTTEFGYPYGVAVDAQGNVLVAEADNDRIRVISPSGDTSTLAGNGTKGFADGTGLANGTAEFNEPPGWGSTARATWWSPIPPTTESA